MKKTAQVISKDNSYVAVDLETTGLNPVADKIIEIGAVRVENGRATAQYSALVNPGRSLSVQTTALTGITGELLRDAKGIEAVLGPAVDFLEGLPLLGHHIIFDYSFLKQAAASQNLKRESYRKKGAEAGGFGMEGFEGGGFEAGGFESEGVEAGGFESEGFETEGIDTLELCRRFMPREEKKNLAAAARYFGIREAPSHRALADAWTAHLLYQAMREQYFTEYSDVFKGKPLKYKVKKQQPATKRQKEVLQDLIKCHKIGVSVQTGGLTRSEASRLTDQIIFRYGRIKR